MVQKKKRKGGQLTSYQDTMQIGNLGNTKEYQPFDYNRYKNCVQMSNFGGGRSKKVENILKNTYIEYRRGKHSYIKKMKGGADQLSIPVADTRNISNLNIPKAYEYPYVSKLTFIHQSKLGRN